MRTRFAITNAQDVSHYYTGPLMMNDEGMNDEEINDEEMNYEEMNGEEMSHEEMNY